MAAWPRSVKRWLVDGVDGVRAMWVAALGATHRLAGAIVDGVKLTKLRGSMQAAAGRGRPAWSRSYCSDKGKVRLCKAAADATGEPIAIANFRNGNHAAFGSMAAVDKVAELAGGESCAAVTSEGRSWRRPRTDFMVPEGLGAVRPHKDHPPRHGDPRRVQRRRGGLSSGGKQACARRRGPRVAGPLRATPSRPCEGLHRCT